MTILLTRRETQLLHLLAAARTPQTVRRLSAELILRGNRGISDQVVRESLAVLARRDLARRTDQHGTDAGYEITWTGLSRAGVRHPPPEAPEAGPRPGPVPEPDPAPDPGPVPDRVQTGQIWEGRGIIEGRRIRIGQVDAGAGMVYYRITRQRPGIIVPRTGGRCRIYSLLAAYRLVSTPAAEEPAVVTHLMITDPAEPGHDDNFSRCCGISWRSLTMSGMVTSIRELVTCPGRPADQDS